MKTKRIFFSATSIPVLGLLLLGASGCASLDDMISRQTTQQREDIATIQEDMRKLSGRIEALELQNQQIQRNMDTLNQQRGASAQVQSLQGRIDDLDGRMRSLEASREKDKQEIVDRLSAKIAQIVKPSPGAGMGSGTATKQSKKAANDVGYEHEVKPGETISAIANAYGVTVKAIIENNEIKDPSKLRAGQKLFIPEKK